jgi:hypothetical protein
VILSRILLHTPYTPSNHGLKLPELLEDELKYADPDSENHLRDIAESELHKVVARPRLVAYTEMVGWALDKVDIPTRSIQNEQGAIVGSFQA